MNMIESFLVNTSNFDAIVEQLKTRDDIPDKITNRYMERIGYSNPSDMLVIHLFKDLKLLNEDGSSTPLFQKFRNPETSQKALAQSIIEGYDKLFTQNSAAHKLQTTDLKELFNSIFEGSKSDLIVKYMVNTFSKLVQYTGSRTIDEVQNSESGSLVMESADNSQQQAANRKNGTAGPSVKQTEEPPAEEFPDVVDTDFDQFTVEETNDEEQQTEKDEIMKDTADNNEEKMDKGQSRDSSSALGKFFEELDQKKEEDDEFSSIFQSLKQEEGDSDVIEESVPTPSDGDESVDQEEDTATSFTPSSDAPAPQEPEPASVKAVSPENKGDTGNMLLRATVKKAGLLYKTNRREEALKAFEQIIRQHKTSNEAFIREHVDMFMIYRIGILEELNNYEQAIRACDEVIERFQHSTKSDHALKAVKVMTKKAGILEKTGDKEESLQLYKTMISHIKKTGVSFPEMKPLLDKAHRTLALNAMEHLDDPARALPIISDAVNHLTSEGVNDESESSLISRLMYHKAELLEQLGRDEEALLAYDRFIQLFGDKPEA